MSDEIKEILDNLKNENNYQVDCNDGSAFKELFANEINLLLDYITNLQEENKELNDDNIWWNNRFKAVERDNRDYKSRNKKAIEYIENNTLYSEDYDYDDEDNLQFQGAYDYKATEDLLEILKGVKKSE